MTSLRCKAFPETIKLEDQTNYRLIEIGKIKDFLMKKYNINNLY